MSETPYPSPETWEYATPHQASRAARSFAELRRRAVPVYRGPLMVADEDDVTLPTEKVVLDRVLILWAASLLGDGVSQDEVLGILEHYDLWEQLSPSERSFLLADSRSADDCRDFVWGLESVWVLLWALQCFDELAWPNAECDVPELGRIILRLEEDEDFANSRQLRCAAEILDAQDLTLRLHWAVRDAYLHQGGMLPVPLDWREDDDWLPVWHCEGAAVVQERHRALAWLTGGLPYERDDADTST